jgi:AraC-like DNA-binding protein
LSLPESQKIWGDIFLEPTADCPINWACHKDAAFVFLNSGSLVIRSEFGSLLSFAGSSFFVPPEAPHLCQILAANTSGWFVSIPKDRCAHLPQKVTAIAHTNLLAALGEKIAQNPQRHFRSAETKRLAEVFFDELKITPAVKAVSIPMPYQGGLEKVAELIIANPSDMKSIDNWAKFVGMSRRVFTRNFLKQTGLPFAAWRRRVKLSAAIRCLRLGHPISEISFQLGYQNPSTFNAVFKKQFGMSPSEYIKDQQVHPALKKWPSSRIMTFSHKPNAQSHYQ